MNLSAASIYQIDERGLELRRSYMRMTPAEFELLSGMQAWADRNADAIGKALAEHTFSAGASGGFLREYANSKNMPIDALKKGWGAAQAGPLQGHLPRGRPARRLRREVLRRAPRRRRAAQQDQPAAEVVPRHLPRVHRPRPRGDDGRRPGARAAWEEGVRPQGRRDRPQVLAAAERALGRIFNYDSQAIVEAFYYDTFASMGVNLKMMGEAGHGRDISDLFGTVRNQMHDTLQTFGASTFEVQDMCSTMNVRLSETGQAINEMAESASRVAEASARQADVAVQGRNAVEQASSAAATRDRAQPHRHRRRDGRHRRFE